MEHRNGGNIYTEGTYTRRDIHTEMYTRRGQPLPHCTSTLLCCRISYSSSFNIYIEYNGPYLVVINTGVLCIRC